MEKESKEGNFQWVYTVQKIVVYLILFRGERELICRRRNWRHCLIFLNWQRRNFKPTTPEPFEISTQPVTASQISIEKCEPKKSSHGNILQTQIISFLLRYLSYKVENGITWRWDGRHCHLFDLSHCFWRCNS